MKEKDEVARCVNRREFIATTAAAGAMLAAGGSNLLGGPKVKKSQVYLVKGAERGAMLAGLLEMFGRERWKSCVAGGRVVVKPNFNSAHEFPGSTHPETLRLLLGEIKAAGAASLIITDRSGMGNTAEVMEKVGATAMAKELGAEIIPYEALPAEAIVHKELPGSHWSRGVEWPKLYEEADCIVQTCCLKTHQYGGHFTLSLKNTVGMVAKNSVNGEHNYMRELHGSPNQRVMIAEINALYEPSLVVLDGSKCLVDGGPHEGTLKEPGVMLAGSDRVALDAVGVAMLRIYGTTPEVSKGKIFEQEQIRRAAELGLGVPSVEGVEIVTPGGVSEEFAAKIREVLAAG